MIDTAFSRDLNKVIEGGLVERDDGRLYIPIVLTKAFVSMTTADYEGGTRINNALSRMAVRETGEKEMPLPDALACLIKEKKIVGIGDASLRATKMNLYSIMYNTLSKKEKELFWCDFWAFNSPRIVNAALG